MYLLTLLIIHWQSLLLANTFALESSKNIKHAKNLIRLSPLELTKYFTEYLILDLCYGAHKLGEKLKVCY